MPANEAHLDAIMFPPAWSRTVDLTIVVPRWPAKSALFVKMPIPRKSNGIPSVKSCSRGGGVFLSVDSLHWGMTQTMWPQERCLQLKVTYAGYKHGGWDGKELRFKIDGKTIAANANNIVGSESGGTVELELFPVAPTAREITIEAFGERDRMQNELHFKFAGLPIH